MRSLPRLLRVDVTNARKIWCFGLETSSTGANLLVDVTKGHGVQYMFQWATKEGVCAKENMCGICLNIMDASVTVSPLL